MIPWKGNKLDEITTTKIVFELKKIIAYRLHKKKSEI